VALSGAALSTSVSSLVERIRVAEAELKDAVASTHDNGTVTVELRPSAEEMIASAESLLAPEILAAVDAAVRGGFRPTDKLSTDALAKQWFDWAAKYLVTLGQFRQAVRAASGQPAAL